MSGSTTRRVHGFISSSFDLLPDEQVVRNGRVSHGYSLPLLASTLLGYNGRLYLTDRRIVFAPDRFLIPRAIYWPPLVAIPLDELKSVGGSKRRSGFYVETNRRRYVFNAISGIADWITAISRTANMSVVD